MIHLTQNAVNKILEISEGEGVGHTIVRVKVLGGGCAGFTQDMTFDQNITENDEVFEQDGVKLVCDTFSFMYLDDCSIDWVDGPIGAGFKFNNPQVKGTCGCGSSVQF